MPFVGPCSEGNEWSRRGWLVCRRYSDQANWSERIAAFMQLRRLGASWTPHRHLAGALDAAGRSAVKWCTRYRIASNSREAGMAISLATPSSADRVRPDELARAQTLAWRHCRMIEPVYSRPAPGDRECPVKVLTWRKRHVDVGSAGRWGPRMGTASWAGGYRHEALAGSSRRSAMVCALALTGVRVLGPGTPCTGVGRPRTG
jgi:hypothetical protein